MKATKRLRQLLERDEVLLAPGAINAMVARLIEQAGFEAVYMTGSGTALSQAGLPDVGLMTMTEMVENASAIAASVSIPVIADADTGYGNPLNVRRTVQQFERSGVAGIHLEDQVYPKKCGHLLGKQLVPVEDMVHKIRAACDARSDPEFVIIARCDARLGLGLDETIRRCQIYGEAGADVLFPESPLSLEEIEILACSFDLPVLFDMSSSGKTPFLSKTDLERMGGFKIMILPNFATLAAIRAIKEVLADIRRTGSASSVRDRCATFEEFMALAGLREIQELEERYSIAEDARTSIT